MRNTAEATLAPWANLDHLAIDHRFPYALGSSQTYTSYGALYDRYFDGPLGQHHNQQVPRFITDFGYDEANGYRQMIKDFSFNAHPSHHMQSTSQAGHFLFIHEHMRNKLKRVAKWLPPEDMPIVRLTNILHDVGENDSPIIAKAVGGVIGDVPHGKKTPEHKRQESKIRKYIFATYYSDLPNHVMERVEAICSHSEDSPAHQTYVWNHDLEALETSLIAERRAREVLLNDELQDRRFQQLRKLAVEVGSRTLQELQPATKRFHVVKDILRMAERRLENFNTLCDKRAS